MLGLLCADDDKAKPNTAKMMIKGVSINLPWVLFILSSFLVCRIFMERNIIG
jgi:hypothetical protein